MNPNRNHVFAVSTRRLTDEPKENSKLYDYVMESTTTKTYPYCLVSPINKTNMKTARSNETDYVMAVPDTHNQYSSNYTYFSSFDTFSDIAVDDNFLSQAFSKSYTILSDPNERIINVEIASQKKIVLTNKKMYIAAQTEETMGEGYELPELQLGDQVKCIRTSSRVEFFFLLTEMGKVYFYGKNNNGIFGLGGDHEKSFSKFTLHEFLSSLPSPVVDIEMGYLFVVVRCKNGDCYGCGYNCYINVGVEGDRTVDVNEFTLVSKLQGQVKKHACGSFHTLFLTFNNELYGCGLMSDGQLGKTWEDQYKNSDCVGLVRIQFENATHFKSISCSGYSSFALSLNNELFHFAKNSGVKHHSMLRKTEMLTVVPLLHADDLIGDFGRKSEELIDIAIMKGNDLFFGIIMCKEGIQKGLIEMESCLKRFAIENGAISLHDATFHF